MQNGIKYFRCRNVSINSEMVLSGGLLYAMYLHIVVVSDANEVFSAKGQTHHLLHSSEYFINVATTTRSRHGKMRHGKKGLSCKRVLLHFLCVNLTLSSAATTALLDSAHVLLLFKKSAFSTKSHRPSDKPKVPFFPLLPTFLYFLKRPSTFELLRVGGYYVGLLVGLLQIFSFFDLFTHLA